MFQKARPFFLYCETPLHAGSGSDLGIVDLPIQRERHTGYPKNESSGLKGAIREAFEEYCVKSEKTSNGEKTIIYSLQSKDKRNFEETEYENLNKKWDNVKIDSGKCGKERIVYQQALDLAFGPETTGDSGHAGALGFSDARILLFPVKSMKGVFGWITCPHILNQFKKDLELAQMKLDFTTPAINTNPKDCNLIINSENKKYIILEEYTFEVTESEVEQDCTKLGNWLAKNVFPSADPTKPDIHEYWREKIKTDIVVLPDDDFRDFVTLSTEVITRTKINNDTGTVQTGALFTEEYLPAETIMYSLALTSSVFNDKDKGIFVQNGKSEADCVMDFFVKGLPEVIQIGGNATLGKGIVRTRVLGEIVKEVK